MIISKIMSNRASKFAIVNSYEECRQHHIVQYSTLHQIVHFLACTYVVSAIFYVLLILEIERLIISILLT